MDLLRQVFDLDLLNLTLRVVAPILLAALGGLLCARAGVFNVALEGMMLAGAFMAVVGAYFLNSALAGVVAGVAGGVLVALIFGVVAIQLKADVIVLGIALNLLAVGATAYGLRVIFDTTGTFYDPTLKGLDPIRVPLLADVPLLGAVLSGHTWLVYVSWLLVAVVWFLLFKQVLGLRIRAVGENPVAAETLGVPPGRIQYIAILLSGVLCGLAGAQLAIGQLRNFTENMTAGRGFIALVAVIFGQAHPVGVFGASLLFGFMEAVGLRLSAVPEEARGNLPVQFIYMLPYLATLLALFLFRKRPLTMRPAGEQVTLEEAKSG
jgi:simple sugar transport system permease protein